MPYEEMLNFTKNNYRNAYQNYTPVRWSKSTVVKLNEITPSAATWMGLEILPNEVSQRERQISYDIVYMQILKHDTNGTYLQNRNRFTKRMNLS